MCLDSRDTPDAVGCRALLVSQIHDQVDLVVGLYKQLFLLSLALSFIRAGNSQRITPGFPGVLATSREIPVSQYGGGHNQTVPKIHWGI